MPRFWSVATPPAAARLRKWMPKRHTTWPASHTAVNTRRYGVSSRRAGRPPSSKRSSTAATTSGGQNHTRMLPIPGSRRAGTVRRQSSRSCPT